MRILPFVTDGTRCPCCGGRTERIRTPYPLRIIRTVVPNLKRRMCLDPACFWRGFSVAVQAAPQPRSQRVAESWLPLTGAHAE